MLLSTAYLPSGNYFKKIISEDAILIEAHEHFHKQTIRNRCHILSPNGIQTLVIPVVHANLNRTAIKDVLISNDVPWQRQHWRSLTAAYRRSAFFEFYEDDIKPFYHTPFSSLLEFNTELLSLILGLLHKNIHIAYNEEFNPYDNSKNDSREICNIGIPIPGNEEIPYPQVFQYKNEFTPGLSIIDLIFNTGNAALTYLDPMLF